MEEEEAIESGDDDSFLDWETRSESTPMSSHIIAGKLPHRSKKEKSRES